MVEIPDIVVVDLNYRVDISDPDLRNILGDKDWHDRLQTLIHYDQVSVLAIIPWNPLLRYPFLQLKKSIVSRKAFDGFLEHTITHLP